jgi:hypothetical protein
VIVRVTGTLLRDLDWQLGDRVYRFVLYDLIAIQEAVAREWETLPRWIEDRDDYRLWIGPCTLAHSASVECQLAPDGAVELVSIVLDFEGLPETGED